MFRDGVKPAGILMKFPGTGWEQPKMMAKNKAFYGLLQLRSPSRASFIYIFISGGNGLK
jgi:hypothetical protein